MSDDSKTLTVAQNNALSGVINAMESLISRNELTYGDALAVLTVATHQVHNRLVTVMLREQKKEQQRQPRIVVPAGPIPTKGVAN